MRKRHIHAGRPRAVTLQERVHLSQEPRAVRRRLQRLLDLLRRGFSEHIRQARLLRGGGQIPNPSQHVCGDVIQILVQVLRAHVIRLPSQTNQRLSLGPQHRHRCQVIEETIRHQPRCLGQNLLQQHHHLGIRRIPAGSGAMRKPSQILLHFFFLHRPAGRIVAHALDKSPRQPRHHSRIRPRCLCMNTNHTIIIADNNLVG